MDLFAQAGTPLSRTESARQPVHRPSMLRARPSHLTLRTKWIFVLAAVFAFAACAGAFYVSQEVRLQRANDELRNRDNGLVTAIEADRHLLDLQMLAISLAGIIVFGGVTVWYFGRMHRDLTAVKERATAIVLGNRDKPLPVYRGDEVGDLMRTVNELAEILDRRERDLEIERRKAFHQEHMATIGALAAGVLDEIGNPIAAIHGVAQAMHESRTNHCVACADELCDPNLILEQTTRLFAIIHQIRELALPRPSERQLLDLNSLVGATLVMLRYDPRVRGRNVQTELDRGLPAVPGMSDKLTQLIMNLVVNAADALVGGRAGRPAIRISTRLVDGSVLLQVMDNGAGMDEATLVRAFEPFFTTKRPGHGTGLGLPLCQSIVAEHGGTIETESAAGVGTVVRVYLPVTEVIPSKYELTANSGGR